MAEAQLASLAGQWSVKPFLTTRCDGTREALAWVATPFGVSLVRVSPPASLPAGTVAGLDGSTEDGQDRGGQQNGGG